MGRRRGRRALIGVTATLAVSTVVMRRRGYGIGWNTIVHCRQGHLFTTIWVPGASLKAVRLEPLVWVRLQRCPVGRHWSLVRPVKDADLTADDRRVAAEHRDIRIP